MLAWRTIRNAEWLARGIVGVTPQWQRVPPGQSMACTGLETDAARWVILAAHPLWNVV